MASSSSRSRSGSTRVCRIVAFINPLSGGQRGEAAAKALKAHLGEGDVFSLKATGGPEPTLRSLAASEGSDLVIVACGGDGTWNWLAGLCMKIEAEAAGAGNAAAFHPEIVPMPLGTGNDLSRALGWGSTYPGDKALPGFLESVSKAARGPSVDIWSVDLQRTGAKFQQFQNYFSVGADALAAYQFGAEREAHPERFKSQMANKGVYSWTGLKLRFHGSSSLDKRIASLAVDGKQVEIPKGAKAIVFLNIPSYGSGTNPWGEKRAHKANKKHFTDPKCNDGILECCVLFSVTAVPKMMTWGKITGYGAKRLAQGSSVRLEFKETPEATKRKTLACQVDGEAWEFTCSREVITLDLKGRVAARLGPDHRPGHHPSVDLADPPPPLGMTPEARAKAEAKATSRADAEAAAKAEVAAAVASAGVGEDEGSAVEGAVAD